MFKDDANYLRLRKVSFVPAEADAMRLVVTETGRWLSKDPIGLNGCLNLYAFCDNKPILYMDPYGKFWGAIISAITTVAIVAYTIIRHALRMKKKMDEADQNDLKDVTIHAIDCTEETLDAITSPLGPPPPTPTSLILDPLVHEITDPIWNEKFNKIRPLK